MAAKKKPNPGALEPNASADAPPSTDNTLIPNDNEDHGKDFQVEDLTDGDFEVNLQPWHLRRRHPSHEEN